MMVAVYQKYLESDTLGLTNATQEIKSIIKERGSENLQIDGHSRGTLTITNAYSSLLNDGDAGKYSNLRTNMVGAAANVKNADRKLAELQGRNDEVLSTDPMNDTAQFKPVYTETEKSEMSIHVQGHKSDFVHTGIGRNKPTGGNNSKGTSTIGEWKNMFGKPATVHSCYGVGDEKCAIKNYWDDSIPKNGQGINNTDLPKWQPIHQPSPKINNNQGE